MAIAERNWNPLHVHHDLEFFTYTQDQRLLSAELSSLGFYGSFAGFPSSIMIKNYDNGNLVTFKFVKYDVDAEGEIFGARYRSLSAEHSDLTLLLIND